MSVSPGRYTAEDEMVLKLPNVPTDMMRDTDVACLGIIHR